MEEWNQAGESEPAPEPGLEPEASASPEAVAPAELPPHGPSSATVRRGLLIWLAMLLALGVGAAISGIQEMAMLVAFAGVFVAAQAADVDPRWFTAYTVLGALIPLGGAGAFVLLASNILNSDTSRTLRIGGAAFAIGAAVLSVLTLLPGVASRLARTLFRSGDDSHTTRLAARVVLFGLLFAFPSALVLPQLLDPMLEKQGGLFESGPLGGELIGYVMLAFASVGFLIRRDLRQSLERLGLRDPRRRDLWLIAAGAGALFALNTGAESLQHALFLPSWTRDHHVNEQMVRGITTRTALLLGVTAGIGEELTLRGALQPKLGILLTSLLFASLHVQYSWFGMLTIFAIGIVLGFLRARAGTTVSIAVHAVYDVLAVFST